MCSRNETRGSAARLLLGAQSHRELRRHLRDEVHARLCPAQDYLANLLRFLDRPQRDGKENDLVLLRISATRDGQRSGERTTYDATSRGGLVEHRFLHSFVVLFR